NPDVPFRLGVIFGVCQESAVLGPVAEEKDTLDFKQLFLGSGTIRKPLIEARPDGSIARESDAGAVRRENRTDVGPIIEGKARRCATLSVQKPESSISHCHRNVPSVRR